MRKGLTLVIALVIEWCIYMGCSIRRVITQDAVRGGSVRCLGDVT